MTTKNERRACARPGLAVCWALAACVAHAQPSPETAASRDALEQQRAAERARAQRELLQPAPDALPPAPPPTALAWPAAESPCFTIREISLTGEASDAFGWTIDTLLHGPDAAIGRCLGAQGLDVAAQRAQQALLERGYVTSRILLPPQDVSQGRLVLGVVPGRIRAIRFADGTNPRANALNALPARPGDLLDLREIEQGLENFKRVPTVTAHIRIEPADAPGQSDLVIDWTQAFPFRLTGTLDDSGTRATGKYQASARSRSTTSSTPRSTR
jgi:hemolysin activation/secretion protein